MLYPTSFPRDTLYLYDFDLYKTKKASGHGLQKSRRDPYRLYDILRHNFPELAF